LIIDFKVQSFRLLYKIGLSYSRRFENLRLLFCSTFQVVVDILGRSNLYFSTFQVVLDILSWLNLYFSTFQVVLDILGRSNLYFSTFQVVLDILDWLNLYFSTFQVSFDILGRFPFRSFVMMIYNLMIQPERLNFVLAAGF